MDKKDLSAIINKVDQISNNAAKGIDRVITLSSRLTGSLVNLSRSYASVGSSIAKTSRTLGIGTQALQELHFIAGRTGVSVNTIETAIKSFSGVTGNAIQGVGKSAQAFDRLGVSLKNSDNSIRSTENVLFDTLTALEKIEDPLQRDAIGMQVFGDNSAAMLQTISGGAGGIGRLRQEANDLAVVMSDKAIKATEEFSNKSFGLGAALTGLRNRIGVHLLPVLTPLIDKFTELAKDIGPVVSQWAEKFASNLPAKLDALWAGFESILAVLGSVGGILAWVDKYFGLVNASIAVFAGAIVFQVVKAITALTLAFRGLGIAISATGIGIIIAVIAALGAGILLVIRNWEFFENLAVKAVINVAAAIGYMGSVWETIKAGIADGIAFVGDILQTMATAVAEAFKFIASVNPFVLIAQSINHVIEALTGFDVLGAISEKLRNLLPNWAIDLLGLDNVSAPVATTIPNSRSEVGGVIRVQIDSEGRARLKQVDSQNNNVPVEVDVGTAMG